MASHELIRRRRLPHWDMPGAAFFLTTCLEGSIPAQGLLEIAQYRSELEKRPRPAGMSEPDWTSEKWKLGFARMERWLDARPAARHLADPALGKIVVDGLYFFAGKRYDLLGYTVMPSHIHWVFQPLDSWAKDFADRKRSPRERIVHSLNRHLKDRGPFWQHESYDHWIRDVHELERILLYIENNPIKAALVKSPEEWRFSSAYDRHMLRLELGQPLLRGAGL